MTAAEKGVSVKLVPTTQMGRGEPVLEGVKPEEPISRFGTHNEDFSQVQPAVALL